MLRFITRLFTISNLVIDTISFIEYAIAFAKDSRLKKEGRLLVNRWEKQYSKQVVSGKLAGYEK